MLCSCLRHNMTLFSEKDHVHLLKDPALTVVNAEGRAQVVLPYRLGAFQPHPSRRDTQTVVRQGLSIMNGAPVTQQLSVTPLNGTAVSNQHQIKTMTPPVLGPQMRISSNGGLRPPAVPAINLQSNGNTVAPPQLIPIPVSQHSPASRAAISMPHVDAQKPEVIVTPAVSNSATPLSQPDANTELSLDASPGRPKAPDPTPQHGFNVHTNGFHLTPMINMTAPTINSSFGQNQHTGGLSLQQMQNLKTAFANIPAPDLAALQNVGRAISASYVNLAVNGTNLNMQLPAGSNIKISPALQMQRAINSASFQKPASGVNGTDGQLNGVSTITAGNSISSSPALRSPLASDVRTPSRNGIHASGQRSLTPHAQPTSSPLLNGTQAQPSRTTMASTAGMSSSLQQ